MATPRRILMLVAFCLQKYGDEQDYQITFDHDHEPRVFVLDVTGSMYCIAEAYYPHKNRDDVMVYVPNPPKEK